MMGSTGIGGRRYQIAALLLTYAAVSLSAVPIGISQYVKQGGKQTASSPGETDNVEFDASAAPPTGAGLIGAVVTLAALGLLSPVLSLSEPLQGLIGLVILYVALQIAWKTTAGGKVAITGPFKA
jgi:hypothetical protein